MTASGRTRARYEAALRWLYGLSARGIRLHLDRMRGAVAARGMPQKGLRVVHVAGSNGKGSVCAMVERGLRAAGYRTGLFTSPHLHRYAERVRIAGRPLGEGEVADRLEELRQAMPDLPRLTFFEVTALLAFEAFRDHAVDAVVLEVGLGGRLDATNVVGAPLCSVVTGIALEHTRILGDTLERFADAKGVRSCGVRRFVGNYLRSSKPSRPNVRPGTLYHLRMPKVNDRHGRAIPQHVRGFDVAVEDPAVVKCFNAAK